jgi:pyridine nucleotide-disulfide oxidoreductase family protein
MKRVVMLGAGHAHLHVLRDLGRERLPSSQLVLVSPFPRQLYSGMVPGLVAGHYADEVCSIPVLPLAKAAGVEFVEEAAVALDVEDRSITLTDGRVAEYDVLSIDTGPVVDRAAIPGAREHAMFVRPMEHFVRLHDQLVALAAQRVLDIVVIGGGAAGFELALAMQYRFRRNGDERARVSLVTGGPPPLAGYGARVVALGQRALKRHRVTVFEDACLAVEACHVRLASGARLACDAPIDAIGASPAPWLAASGLALDEQGFVATGATLQSTSHPNVFAVGDAASRVDAPHPKSGVYAVRAGPPLALNLRRQVAGGALAPYEPRRRSLNLLSCGDRRAILSWGDWSVEGRWAWWWKDRIDRGFVAGFG